MYDPTVKKYLVLIRDDVESAEEKLQELQQEMQDMGLMGSDFDLGDLVEENDNETQEAQNAKKKKLVDFPTLEGEESVGEYLGQYRRAVLSRKALYKTARERLEKEASTGHELLSLQITANT